MRGWTDLCVDKILYETSSYCEPNPFTAMQDLNDAAGAGQKPEVFAVSIKGKKIDLDRRAFIEVMGAAGIAAGLAGCSSPQQSTSNQSPNTPPRTNAPPGATTPPPGKVGTVAKGQTGINYRLSGRTYTLPCNSPIPAGAVCTCNCVTVPMGRGTKRMNGTVCTCNLVCTCDTVCGCNNNVVTSHYWYPN